MPGTGCARAIHRLGPIPRRRPAPVSSAGHAEARPPDGGSASHGPRRLLPPDERAAARCPPAAIPLSGLALGIDVGGTGVKAALVDLATARAASASRVREKTPQPSTPEAVLETIASVVERVLAEHAGPATRPAHRLRAARRHQARRHEDRRQPRHGLGRLRGRRRASAPALGRPVHVINDADAAGMAELAYGEARGQPGTVILLTVGHRHRQRARSATGASCPTPSSGTSSCAARTPRRSSAAPPARAAAWAGSAGRASSTSTSPGSSSTSGPTCIILGGGVSKEYARSGATS